LLPKIATAAWQRWDGLAPQVREAKMERQVLSKNERRAGVDRLSFLSDYGGLSWCRWGCSRPVAIQADEFCMKEIVASGTMDQARV
jgi:hypothetical protein